MTLTQAPQRSKTRIEERDNIDIEEERDIHMHTYKRYIGRTRRQRIVKKQTHAQVRCRHVRTLDAVCDCGAILCVEAEAEPRQILHAFQRLTQAQQTAIRENRYMSTEASQKEATVATRS